MRSSPPRRRSLPSPRTHREPASVKHEAAGEAASVNHTSLGCLQTSTQLRGRTPPVMLRQWEAACVKHASGGRLQATTQPQGRLRRPCTSSGRPPPSSTDRRRPQTLNTQQGRLPSTTDRSGANAVEHAPGGWLPPSSRPARRRPPMVSTQHADFRQQAARRAEERMEQSASEGSFSRQRREAHRDGSLSPRTRGGPRYQINLVLIAILVDPSFHITNS